MAYINAGGNASIACVKAGIAKSTFYKWQDEDTQFRQQIEMILSGIKYCGEDKILAAAIEGDIKSWNTKLKDVTSKLNKLSQKPKYQSYNKNNLLKTL